MKVFYSGEQKYKKSVRIQVICKASSSRNIQTSNCHVRWRENMDFLKSLGIESQNLGASTGSWWNCDDDGLMLKVISPVDGKIVASVKQTSMQEYERVVRTAESAFAIWRMVPAPKRGDIVRQIGLNSGPSRNRLACWFPTRWASPFKRGWVKCRRW